MEDKECIIPIVERMLAVLKRYSEVSRAIVRIDSLSSSQLFYQLKSEHEELTKLAEFIVKYIDNITLHQMGWEMAATNYGELIDLGSEYMDKSEKLFKEMNEDPLMEFLSKYCPEDGKK